MTLKQFVMIIVDMLEFNFNCYEELILFKTINTD